MSDNNVYDEIYDVPTGGSPYRGSDEGEEAAISIARQKDCSNAVLHHDETPFLAFTMAGSASPVEVQEATSSGSDNDYWVAEIIDPKRLAPYQAECEDLIELFQMTFQEGEAFKALWRNGQMRLGKGKPDDSHLRNAQKVRHFGARMEVIEGRKLAAASVS